MTTETQQTANWAALLREAVEKPGLILEAYSSFHGYSIGNCLLALLQCRARGISPGPIATYKRWQELGRQVRKGEKALTLCMPVTRRRNARDEEQDPAGDEESFCTFFVYRARWFVLSQTEGDDIERQPIRGWEKHQALRELGITEELFEATNGNMQGYSAPGRKIAINPLAQLPHKTLFHELAHQVLGHVGDQALVEVERLPKNLREVEAESVALICCEALALEGAPYCRGYIQAWLAGDEIPKRSAQRIFAAAEKILRAGTQRDLFAWSARVAPTLRRSDPLGYRTTALQARRKVFLEEHVGQRIRDLRKAKRIRQKTLARIVGISPGALTNFEKGRRRISIDWLQKIAEALDTPLAYFLDGDRRGRSKIVPGDPREKRLIQAWRSLGKQPTLRADFLRLVEHLRGRPRR